MLASISCDYFKTLTEKCNIIILRNRITSIGIAICTNAIQGINNDLSGIMRNLYYY